MTTCIGMRRVVAQVVAVAASVPILVVAPAQAASATIIVSSSVIGTSPVLGYNIAHGMDGSNAADWWRYDGAKAARVFLSVSDIEPTDDITGTGDGVTSKAIFESRRAALRANASSNSVPLDFQYVNWTKFLTAYGTVATGNNRFAVSSWFPQLRAQGVDILANITASPSRFPIANATDYANIWELWQHFYAQAFILSRDYGVVRYGTFNEPNNWSPAISVENWALRVRIASDAIRSAIADMNLRYGRSLVAKVFAPNTANGATKYDDTVTGDYWGRQAVSERMLDMWGAPRPSGPPNFDVYNYQKYSTSASTYATDYEALTGKISLDAPGGLPMALTEYNVRTGSEYDATTSTADSPSDFSSLGATSVALAAKGVSELYLFKYGMTERTGGTYPVAKNGTHYVQNSTSTSNNYGGAAGTAEVYRLFMEASGRGRSRLATISSLGSAVAVQATRDDSNGVVHVFIANTSTSAVTVDIDVSSLGVADGSLVTVKEVSSKSRGGVVRQGSVATGRVPVASMPAQAVWLVSVHSKLGSGRDIAVLADVNLTDGSLRTTPNGGSTVLDVRADGTANGRKLALLRFAVPSTWKPEQRVLLSLPVAASSGTSDVQAHVYGLDIDSWTESATSFSTLTTALRQNVGGGTTISSNVVAGQGSVTRILGQVMTSGTSVAERLIDVTDFVISQSDGFASFLIVQDHRWDVKLPERTTGDVQSAGLRLSARESGAGAKLRLLEPAMTAAVAPTFNPSSGTYTGTQIVTLSTNTTGATIRYTTDGTTPSASNGVTYSGPFNVSTSMTVRAVAMSAGLIDSPVSSATYVIDAPVGSTFSAEFERLAVVATSGDSSGIKNDTGASGGKSVLYRANAVGDFITFALTVPTAGNYSVSMSAKMANDRSQIQLEYATSPSGPWTSIDSPKDEYRLSVTFGSIGVFVARVSFPNAGTIYLRLRVVGRNGASSGFFVSADRITFSS